VLKRSLNFSFVPGSFAVCHLPAGAPVPEWALQSTLFSITRTLEELSIVCPAALVPEDVQHEANWTCLKLIGPFPFAETGILSSFIQPLSENSVPIFAISTFDTDYVLIKEEWAGHALNVLQAAGHQLI
jgi:uncharacterized protein